MPIGPFVWLANVEVCVIPSSSAVTVCGTSVLGIDWLFNTMAFPFIVHDLTIATSL